MIGGAYQTVTPSYSGLWIYMLATTIGGLLAGLFQTQNQKVIQMFKAAEQAEQEINKVNQMNELDFQN
jgi:hypothetical protein